MIEQLSDRRVEWVIRDIAAKLQEFPKGSRMLSPDFAAFGIAKLGLVLSAWTHALAAASQ